MPSKTVTGARAKVYIADPNTGKSTLVGAFSQISWGLTFDAQPVHILGRFGPTEIVYTAQEPVSVQATGFKVIGAGVHKLMGMPNTRDLLTHEYLEMVIVDRQTGREMTKIHSLRPISYQTQLNARNLEEISVNYMGLLVDDEDTQLSEAPDATSL